MEDPKFFTFDSLSINKNELKLEDDMLKSHIVLPISEVFKVMQEEKQLKLEYMQKKKGAEYKLKNTCQSRENKYRIREEMVAEEKRIMNIIEEKKKGVKYPDKDNLRKGMRTLIREIFKKNDEIQELLGEYYDLNQIIDCKDNQIEIIKIIKISEKVRSKYIDGQTIFNLDDLFLNLQGRLCIQFILDFGASCVHENSMVTMADETKKMVKNIQKGDEVKTNQGKSKVKCILKTNLINGSGNFVKLASGLLITPWHPVKVNGNWEFPIHNSSKFVQKECQAVYSFLLENDHVLLIDNTEVCGLAHNFKGEVIEHDYYGTDKVVKDLEKMEGYNQGLVEVQQGNCIIRDSTTGNVSGLYQSKQTKHSLYL